jgi:CheY-like chemotaxis protein
MELHPLLSAYRAPSGGFGCHTPLTWPMRSEVPAMIKDQLPIAQPDHASCSSMTSRESVTSSAGHCSPPDMQSISRRWRRGSRAGRGRAYGLVILDLIMPDMDGRVVLTEILRLQPEQSILVLSCLEDVATKVACLELGAQDYLTKPFSLAELLARVRARLRAEVISPARCSGRVTWCWTWDGCRPTSATAPCPSRGWSSCCSGS